MLKVKTSVPACRLRVLLFSGASRSLLPAIYFWSTTSTLADTFFESKTSSIDNSNESFSPEFNVPVNPSKVAVMTSSRGVEGDEEGDSDGEVEGTLDG
jgi:hypothetical protein